MNSSISSSQRWSPPNDLKDHCGRPARKDWEYFVTPPREIGQVVSAWSDLRANQTLWSLPVKLGIAAIVIILAVGVIVWVNSHSQAGTKNNLPLAISFMVAIAAIPVGLALALKRRWVSYVGTEGFAFYATRNGREGAAGKFIRYSDIADIDIRQVSQKRTSIDSGGDVKCIFSDASGQPIAKWRTKIVIVGGKRRPNHLFDLAMGVKKRFSNEKDLVELSE